MKKVLLRILIIGIFFLCAGSLLRGRMYGSRTIFRLLGKQKQQATNPPKQLKPVPPTIIGEKAYKVPVLRYHYISVNGGKDDKIGAAPFTPPKIFEEQLKLMAKRGYTTITLDELAAAFDGKFILPVKPVILTFDDGYADFYFTAAPLLQKYQMKAIAFIATGLIGGGNYMTWGQIEELAKSPLIVFGAHSVHHDYLHKVAQEVLIYEVEESKRVLESHIGYRVNWFAYPFGFFNEAVVTAVQKAGFIGSVTTIPESLQYQSRFFYIPRLRGGTTTGGSFLKLLQSG